MSQYPYSHGPYDADAMSEPPRTSAMAVVSLVISFLGCCSPVGLLAALLGMFSLVGISKSQGRVTGKGLAIAAIIIGLITAMVGIGVYIGSGVLYKRVYAGLTEPLMADIEAGDFNSAQSSLVSTITTEQLTQFREAYHNELGNFTGVPGGWFEAMEAFSDPNVGSAASSASGQQGVIPIPGYFDQGTALMIFRLDQRTTNQSGVPTFSDIVIVLPNGDELKLSAPAINPPPTEAPATPDDADSDG